jgi:glycine dehydrogenase subunit 1
MRYLGLTDDDRATMLEVIGADSIDALYCDVPESAVLDRLVDLPLHEGEIEVECRIAAFAGLNRPVSSGPSFLGCGAYRHHVPATVDHIVQRGEFMTAYTPYQPEVSQGTLQYLFEFQTQLALITGMDVASASHYDGATACAEAVLMARRITKRPGVALSGALHPHYRDAVIANLRFSGSRPAVLPPDLEGAEDITGLIDDATACVVVQSPDAFGRARDLAPIAAACHEAGALLVAVVTEIVSLGLMRSPGEMGADIVAAEGQSLGNALSFGGPYLGMIATRDAHVRQLPGRIAGQATDADGKRGWVLTLSAREQHIRREKATSNICTNSGLCALAFAVHLALLGEDGFRRLAELNHAAAARLADRLSDIQGISLATDCFFNEFAIRLGRPAGPLVERLAADGIFAGVPGARLWPGVAELDDVLIVAATELATDVEMDALAGALRP